LRFGKFSPFDYLANFIHQDSDLICSKGFLLFENISSVSNRLFKSNSHWAIIPDSTDFGFDLLVKDSQQVCRYKFFPIRSNGQCIFHRIIQENDIPLGEDFSDVLNFFGLNLEDGLPPEEIKKVMNGEFPFQDAEEHNVSFDVPSPITTPEDNSVNFSWMTNESLFKFFDFF
jgi:hypothetical protein